MSTLRDDNASIIRNARRWEGCVTRAVTISGRWQANAIGLAIISVAVGIAILRHHLYDIDLLINRTVVYGVLTTGLGLLYWGNVIVLQQVLRPLTQGLELAIIGSTLLVAAVFNSARHRIQHAIDRRFYRRKYDAQQMLQPFSTRLRQEIDLDSLSAELLGVVRDSLQPARVSLWLRPSAQRASRDAPSRLSSRLWEPLE